MSPEDALYVLLLFISILLGEFIRRLDSPCLKKYASTAIGLVMAYVVAGNDVWHAVIVTGVNALIISTFPNRCLRRCLFSIGLVLTTNLFQGNPWLKLRVQLLLPDVLPSGTCIRTARTFWICKCCPDAPYPEGIFCSPLFFLMYNQYPLIGSRGSPGSD